MIKILKKTFWFPFSSKVQIEKYQKDIRDIEWNSFKKHISIGVNFLDVGCGAGDNLNRAKSELNCQVTGIDPSPGSHGVGRFTENKANEIQIIQGTAEDLPFKNEEFDLVFCSHVLEHVTNQTKSLKEIKRVLKKDGTVIIGMPTASMAIIAVLSHYLFTTHVNFLFFLKSIGKKEMLNRLIHLFIPASHSMPNHKYVSYDLWNYRISKWREIISSEFSIEETITPCLYPYPDYIQWFPKLKLRGYSSSVFFICKKK
jgi:ubiquinone/menaquinone biosynthesis C-methylase UbiE